MSRLVATARRELVEETGYETDDVGRVVADQLEAAPGMGSIAHAVVLLRGCRLTAEASHQADESIQQVETFDRRQIREMVTQGKIRTLPSIAGLWFWATNDSSDTNA